MNLANAKRLAKKLSWILELLEKKDITILKWQIYWLQQYDYCQSNKSWKEPLNEWDSLIEDRTTVSYAERNW